MPELHFLDRRSTRRVLRQVFLLLVSVFLVLAISTQISGRTPIGRLSLASAYVGLLFLAIVLFLGPLNVLRGTSNPPSTYLRRDIGVTAGLLALVHTFAGLQVHLGGDIVRYFFAVAPTGPTGPLLNVFGLANYSGAFADVIFLVLLAISSNLMLRSLGPRRWKRIQRWTYAAAAAVVVHAFAYQLLERRMIVFVALVAAIAAACLAIQLLALTTYRRSYRQGPVRDRQRSASVLE